MKIELDHLRPINRVQKIWGEEWWLDNEEFCTKLLFVKPGFQCSLHYHPVKRESFRLLSGALFLEQRDIRGIPFEEFLAVGDRRLIEPKTPHRFRSYEGAVILESSTHHDDADVVRLVESGPIECTPCKQKSLNS